MLPLIVTTLIIEDHTSNQTRWDQEPQPVLSKSVISVFMLQSDTLPALVVPPVGSARVCGICKWKWKVRGLCQ